MIKKNNEKKYIVYIHECPNKKKYVGVTSRKTYQRWHGGNAYKFNNEFTDDIKKYGWENIKHTVIEKNLSQNEAYNLEQRLIKKYNTTNKDFGYNKQNGGEKGKNTYDIKSKISIKLKGRKLSETTKKKLREQKLGNKNPMYNKKPSNCKKVIQLDINNNVLKIWNDLHEAEESLKIHHSNIIKCCKNQRKTTGGYKWRYYEL